MYLSNIKVIKKSLQLLVQKLPITWWSPNQVKLYFWLDLGV